MKIADHIARLDAELLNLCRTGSRGSGYAERLRISAEVLREVVAGKFEDVTITKEGTRGTEDAGSHD